MNRFVKALCIILSLLLAILLLIVMILGAPYLDLQPAHFFDSLFLNRYFWQSSFWLAASLMVLLITSLLIVLFYPKLQQQFILKSSGGQLVLEKKAIEGFIRSKLSSNDFVGQPKIKVRATKHKIRVLIKAQLKRTSSLINQTDTFRWEIQQELQQLLGIKEKVVVDVNFIDYQDHKQSVNNPRVV
ncbi:alkaline shock response membrane anchor protein AmaP [Lapidilactobacillus gannanensis]|uniref:Alkaline shock response membrane anchor protein AmaP n=1 Tax=Lapidilactobacillus gannanensis TaxID=2486002 RepID=A0ABW4BK40_9LACO|nr:alkaline shock response membrane anchor protein AmaP [Lapidilactobacillus gannanensis]